MVVGCPLTVLVFSIVTGYTNVCVFPSPSTVVVTWTLLTIVSPLPPLPPVVAVVGAAVSNDLAALSA